MNSFTKLQQICFNLKNNNRRLQIYQILCLF